jgi:putative FmdB family regulatory protein
MQTGQLSLPSIRVFDRRKDFRYIRKGRREMPIFEFQCRNCGAKFERIVTSATTSATCQNCGSPQVEKLLSTFAVVSNSVSASPSAGDPCSSCGARERGLCKV